MAGPIKLRHSETRQYLNRRLFAQRQPFDESGVIILAASADYPEIEQEQIVVETRASSSAFTLAGYGDICQIGAGGMAIVYSATQLSFKRKVAIKVLMPAYTSDKEFADRFLREAQIVSSLSHPHIIPVYDFGESNGSYYIVMEHMAGGDLAKRIQKGMTEEDILLITSDVASALHYAHQKGFIHRDVKPDNVMFREDGSAVLTDFGIARNQNANTQMTRAGQTVGTPRYMSPQQLQGRQVDGRTDIYSLGMMFYEMFTKQTPYQDEDFMALALKHLQAPIPKLPEQYRRYQKLFERMVAKEPEKRFQTGAEVIQLIEQIRAGKVDAANIDSGAAAALKTTIKAQADSKLTANKTPTPNNRVHIPREILIALQDMDPLLDKGWNKMVSAAFNKLGAVEKRHVYDHFLEPKGIFLDAQKKQFVFRGRKTVQEVTTGFIRNAALQAVAAKILKIELSLRSTTEIHVFSDAIESGLSLIDRFDPQDSLAAQKEKMLLRSAFLDDLVPLVREAQFVVPSNRRSLTMEMIKLYIIEVYLKHEMMGYRFKTLSYTALEEDADKFLSGHVAAEARIRQCDIVKTESYLYLIGPVRDFSQNPYSIRRFLQEDTTMGGQVVYFNVVAITLNATHTSQEEVKWQLSRIVTLERQLSFAVTDLVQKMEESYKKELRPLLLKDIGADGTDIEEAIKKRLADYERRVSLLVLGKIPKALREMAKTQDDFEYLFANVRRLVIELACDIRDFAAQSTMTWSDKADQLDLRMMSYLKLLDKRKTKVFCSSSQKAVDPKEDPVLLTQELKNALEQTEAELEELNEQLRLAVLEQNKKKSGMQLWIESLFGSDKNKVTPEMLDSQITRTKNQCLIALIKVIKRYPLITVYLEFESITPVSDDMRHYAICTNKDGVSRLPALLTMQEKAENFNLPAVRRMIEEDAFNTASWAGSIH